MVTGDKSLINWRVISAECQKSPEFGRIFYESGPLLGARILADALKKWADAGLHVGHEKIEHFERAADAHFEGWRCGGG